MVDESSSPLSPSPTSSSSSSSQEQQHQSLLWWQQEEQPAHDHLMSQLMIHCPRLVPIVERSLHIIDEALDRYELDEMCIGFNGGKDSVVLLNIVLLGVFRRYHHYHIQQQQQQQQQQQNKTLTDNDTTMNHHVHNNNTNHQIMQQYFNRILCFHLFQPDEFPEMVQFLLDQIQLYQLNMKLVNHESSSSQSSFKSLLSYLLQEKPRLKAVFMGTRHNDPHGQYVSNFSPTDPTWPQMMRISPILHWNYEDIWDFTNVLHIPYCVLYDRGYTSIGSVKDTIPNPHLLLSMDVVSSTMTEATTTTNDDDHDDEKPTRSLYKRACMLHNGNEYERFSRFNCTNKDVTNK